MLSNESNTIPLKYFGKSLRSICIPKLNWPIYWYVSSIIRLPMCQTTIQKMKKACFCVKIMPSYSLPSYNHACKTQTSTMVTYSNERGLMGKLSRTHIHFIYTLFSQQNIRSICSILRHTHNHSANNIFFIYFYFKGQE